MSKSKTEDKNRPSRAEGNRRSNTLGLAKAAYRRIVTQTSYQDSSDVRLVVEQLANCANGDDYAKELMDVVPGLTRAEADALGSMDASGVFHALVQKLDTLD